VLNLIAGLDVLLGSVVVQDRDLAKLSRENWPSTAARCGMVFQSFNLIASMTLVENVELPLRFAEVDRSRRQTLASEALERVGLRARMKPRPANYRRRTAESRLGACLINRPQLLLADEPTEISTATPERKS